MKDNTLYNKVPMWKPIDVVNLKKRVQRMIKKREN